MIQDVRSYHLTKSSGAEWLGRVPQHWPIKRFKSLLRESGSRSTSGLEQLLRVSQYTGVTERKALPGQDASDTRARSLVGYRNVEPGNLVVNIMLAWNGSMGVSHFRGIASPAYCVYEFRRDVNPWYFHYLLRSTIYKARIKAASTGVVESRLRLYTDDLYRLECIVPPRSEQDTIVRFLKHVDRRISRYIRAKERLMELLEEEKQATIHQAVTGQTDVRTSQPYSAYKDSGGEWLEKIPAHWEVARLGKLIILTTGFPFKSEGFTQNARDLRLLRGVNVAPGRLRWREVVRWPAADAASYGEYLLETGDIVLGMDRPVIRAGTRVALVSECDVPSLLLQRVARIRPGRRIRRDFALLLLRGKAFADYLAPIFTGISVPHLSPEQIRGFRLPLPSVEEQDEILEGLSLGIRAIEREKDRAKSQIELLREYRTRLIADVVTGKVDVRKAAAQLPDADPLETDDALEDTPSTDQPADLDEPGIQRNELRS